MTVGIALRHAVRLHHTNFAPLTTFEQHYVNLSSFQMKRRSVASVHFWSAVPIRNKINYPRQSMYRSTKNEGEYRSVCVCAR